MIEILASPDELFRRDLTKKCKNWNVYHVNVLSHEVVNPGSIHKGNGPWCKGPSINYIRTEGGGCPISGQRRGGCVYLSVYR